MDLQKTEFTGPKKLTYEKPQIKDLGDLFELTAGGTVTGGHDQRFPNSPKAVKCVITCFS